MTWPRQYAESRLKISTHSSYNTSCKGGANDAKAKLHLEDLVPFIVKARNLEAAIREFIAPQAMLISRSRRHIVLPNGLCMAAESG